MGAAHRMKRMFAFAFAICALACSSSPSGEKAAAAPTGPEAGATPPDDGDLAEMATAERLVP